jgi:hypothetical protein
MGLTVNTPHMFYANLFGVNKQLVADASAAGMDVVLVTNGLGITKAGVVSKVVTCKVSAITLAKNGTLGPSSKDVIRVALEGAISTVLGVKPPPFQGGTPGYVSPGQKAAATKMAAQVAVADPDLDSTFAKAPAKPPAGSLGDLLKSKLASQAPAGTLAKATSLFQPVEGTSNGSVYTTVALFPTINVAIRRTVNKLSVRAEGPGLTQPSVAAALQSMGMNIKSGEGYASVHYDVSSSDAILTRKVIGSLVGALALPNQGQVADPHQVKVVA